MSRTVNITSKGIRKILKNYNPAQAIAEYIWNGFDAKADTIHINYSFNELGSLNHIEIIDNGSGIDFEKLKSKFDPFYDSEKAIEISSPKHTSITHGKNGVGRLTFFSFANTAEWFTAFNDKVSTSKTYIRINADSLNNYESNQLTEEDAVVGTKVRFTNISISKEELEKSIIPFLIIEFCWFLELNKSRNFKVIINDTPIDYASNILEVENKIDVLYEKTNTHFKFRFVQWKQALHKEFSKYYFQDNNAIEVYKDFTTLNNKGDGFFHSVYIESNFFKEFDFRSNENDSQSNIFGKAKSSPEYKFVIKKVNEHLRKKRKPFLRIYANRMVETFDQNGILPLYKNEWEEKFKKPQLIEAIIGLYEAQPKLFTNLNLEQKKTFVRFLDLLLDSNERERVFSVLNEIIDLEPEERQDLADLFKTTSLSRTLETIKLIKDRYETYYKLKDIVFNKDLKANEVDHLQKLIEKHYWIFGEQFHLVTAAEPKFQEALNRYVHYLTEKDTCEEIEHQHKLKEMDIFACRQNTFTDRIENIVVELKHPLINLGVNQYNQVYNYLDVILKQPEFNAPNMFWEFYLIGNKFDTTNFLKNHIESNKPHGLKSLILNLENGRIKVFAKTWSEIFAEFEIKHKHLNEKLQLERQLLLNEQENASEVVVSVQNNTAVQPVEMKDSSLRSK